MKRLDWFEILLIVLVMSISLYAAFADGQNFSWRWYFDTARRCKLYDFAQRCWTDYAGRPTGTAGS